MKPWEKYGQAGSESEVPAPAGPWAKYSAGQPELSAGNVASNVAQRGTDLAGNTAEFFGNILSGLEVRAMDALGTEQPLTQGLADVFGNPGIGWGTPESFAAEGREPAFTIGDTAFGFGELPVRLAGEGLSDVGRLVESTDTGYDPQYTIDRALDDPTLRNIGGAIAEQGPSSLVDMAALLMAPGPYLAGRTQEVAEARQASDLRDGPLPSNTDYAVALPTATIIQAIDRLALGKLLPKGSKVPVTSAGMVPGAIARAAGVEAATEAGQEGIEYVGTAAGTETGLDGREAIRRMIGGAMIGGPVGGLVRGGSSVVELRQAIRQQLAAEGVDPNNVSDSDLDVAIAEYIGQAEEASQAQTLAPESVAPVIEQATGVNTPAPLGTDMPRAEARQARRQVEQELGSLFEGTDVLRREDVDVTPEGLQLREGARPAQDPVGRQAQPSTLAGYRQAAAMLDEAGVELTPENLDTAVSYMEAGLSPVEAVRAFTRAARQGDMRTPPTVREQVGAERTRQAAEQAFRMAEARRERAKQDTARVGFGRQDAPTGDYRAGAARGIGDELSPRMAQERAAAGAQPPAGVNQDMQAPRRAVDRVAETLPGGLAGEFMPGSQQGPAPDAGSPPRTGRTYEQWEQIEGEIRQSQDSERALADQLRLAQQNDPDAVPALRKQLSDQRKQTQRLTQEQAALPAPGQTTAPDTGFDLTQQTEAEAKTLADQLREAEARAAKAEADLAARQQADADRNDFTLTGSNRAADVAAARGQQDLLSQPAAEQTAETRAGDDRRTEQASIAEERRETAGRREGESVSEVLQAYMNGDELTLDQWRLLATHSEVTPLRNKREFTRAWVEHQRRKAADPSYQMPKVVFIDADSLKWYNDNVSHEAGDALLVAVGEELVDAGADAFHVSGDEFLVIVADDASGAQMMDAVQERLAQRRDQFTSKDGQEIEINGYYFTYGVGDNVVAADKKMQATKEAKEKAGERAARGEQPASVRYIGDDAGAANRSSQAGDPAGEPVGGPAEGSRVAPEAGDRTGGAEGSGGADGSVADADILPDDDTADADYLLAYDEYAQAEAAPAEPRNTSERQRTDAQRNFRAKRDVVQPEVDTIAVAVGKLGGVDPDLTGGEIDVAPLRNAGVPGRPTIRRRGTGRSLDDLAESLMQYGYRGPGGEALDPSNLAVLLNEHAGGKPTYSQAVDYDLVDEMRNRRRPNTQLYSGIPLDAIADAVKRLFGGETKLWQNQLARNAELFTALKESMQGRRPSVNPIAQAVRWYWFDADQRLRSIADRAGMPGVKRVADAFLLRAGDAVGTGRETFHSRLNKRLNKQIDRVEGIRKAFDDAGLTMNDETMLRVRRMLENPSTPRIGKLGDVVRKMETFFQDELAYQRDAGLETGEVKGYLPRVIDKGKISANDNTRARFVAAAAKAYKIDNPRMTDTQARELGELRWQREVFGESSGTPGLVLEAGSPGSADFMKGRTLSQKAVEQSGLQDFMVNNPFNLMLSYLQSSAMRAELAKTEVELSDGSTVRIGPNWSNWSQIKQDLVSEGGDAAYEFMPEIEDMVATVSGIKARRHYGRFTRGLSWARTISTLGLLELATLTSLPEPLIGGIRMTKGGSTGGAMMDLANVVKSTARYGGDAARLLLRLPKRERLQATYDLLHSLGEINANNANAMSVDRFAGGEPASLLQSNLLAAYFRGIRLEQFTNYSVAFAAENSMTFMRQLAQDLAAGGKRADNARIHFRDLNVPAGEIDSFAAFVQSLDGGNPTAGELANAGRNGALYAGAMNKFIGESVMRPNAATKPAYAAHPLGASIFQLQSFPFMYTKQVLSRPFRVAQAQAADIGKLEAAYTALPFIVGLTTVVGLQSLLGGMRDEFAELTSGEENPPQSQMFELERALSWAGAFGKVDPILQMISGSRYQKSVFESAAGPTIGRIADGLDTALAAAVNNSPNTTSAERQLWNTSMDLLIEPLLQATASLAPDTGVTGAVMLAARAAGPRTLRERGGEALAPREKERLPRYSLAEKLVGADKAPKRDSGRERGREGGRENGRW